MLESDFGWGEHIAIGDAAPLQDDCQEQWFLEGTDKVRRMEEADERVAAAATALEGFEI